MNDLIKRACAEPGCGRPFAGKGRWCERHRAAGEARAAAARARARRPGRSTKDPQAQVRYEVLAAAMWCCYWCNGPATETDHLVPVKLGGADDRSNLVAACRTCNGSRGASGEPPKRLGNAKGGVGPLGPKPSPPGSSPPPHRENRETRSDFFSGPRAPSYRRGDR